MPRSLRRSPRCSRSQGGSSAAGRYRGSGAGRNPSSGLRDLISTGSYGARGLAGHAHRLHPRLASRVGSRVGPAAGQQSCDGPLRAGARGSDRHRGRLLAPVLPENRRSSRPRLHPVPTSPTLARVRSWIRRRSLADASHTSWHRSGSYCGRAISSFSSSARFRG
jgi:hypothetical protein